MIFSRSLSLFTLRSDFVTFGVFSAPPGPPVEGNQGKWGGARRDTGGTPEGHRGGTPEGHRRDTGGTPEGHRRDTGGTGRDTGDTGGVPPMSRPCPAVSRPCPAVSRPCPAMSRPCPALSPPCPAQVPPCPASATSAQTCSFSAAPAHGFQNWAFATHDFTVSCWSRLNCFVVRTYALEFCFCILEYRGRNLCDFRCL